jgi:hypothetical protein
MTAGAGTSDGLRWVKSTRRGKNHDVDARIDKNIIERFVRSSARPGGRRCQSRWIDVADGRELCAVNMSFDRVDMVRRDAPAANEREPNLSIGDEGLAAKEPISQDTLGVAGG